MATINGIVKELQKIKGTVRDKNRISASVAAILLQGEGMTGEFTDIEYTPHSPTLNIAGITSDKIKWTVDTGAGESIEYLGTSTSGTLKLLWISLVHPSTVKFKSKTLGTNGIFQTGLMVGVTEIEYTRTLSADYLFMCECLGGNQWLLTEVGGLANTAIGWQNALLDYVEKETGKSLVADTEIAKIHSQNTDNQLRSLDGGTIVSVEDLATIMDLTHSQNTDTILDDGGANEVSAAEIRGVVDFANIATPPTAYQIPVVQDITGVKSLKYSADFVFENGTLKVKGAGNTTGKTLSIFNLAGTENVVVLDNGNVGIGTNTPSYRLDLSTGAIRAGNAIITSQISTAVFTSFSETLDAVLQGRTGYGVNIKYNGGTSGIYLKNDGNVGIGTTVPVMRLDVSQPTGQCFRMRYDGSTTYKADFTLDSSGKLTIAAAGNVEFTGDVNLTGVLKIDGVQVVKEQQANILDLKSDYNTGELDSEAEIITAINDIAKKIKEVTDAMKAHGLIASA